MGASNCREEDAALLLAAPKHVKFAGRRILDTKAKKCFICSKDFGVIRKKHYCRRCGSIVCDDCSTFRHYKRRSGHAFRICDECNRVPVLHTLPQRVWQRIISYVGNAGLHRTMQVCRKMQLSVPLTYEWGAAWDQFFREGQFLSKGANGSVYKTTLKSDPSRHVAVKVVHKNTIFSLRKWHHIQREIDALTACKHNHVIEILGVYQSPESVFIVLQFAQGGDLFDWLMARKAPTEYEVRAIAGQLMSTLHHIHSTCNAVHRDLKPENILLEKRTRNGDVPHIRLADFGFARVFGGASQSRPSAEAIAIAKDQINAIKEATTVSATPCGTLGFAAPEILEAYSERRQIHRHLDAIELAEQNRSDKKAAAEAKKATAALRAQSEGREETSRAAFTTGPETSVEMMKKMDIFAAGVTVCILLTGCEPFPCASSKAHIEAVQHGVRFEGRHWAHVSQDAKDLLRRMLHADAAKRPSAWEVMQSSWLRQSLVPATATEKAASTPDVKSFAESLRSLRKNDGTVFVTDKSGNVSRRKREEVVEDTLQEEAPIVIASQRFLGDVVVTPAPGSGAIAMGNGSSSVASDERHY